MTRSPRFPDASKVLRAVASGSGGLGFAEVLAAEAPTPALTGAWNSADEAGRILLARTFRNRRTWQAVPLLADALSDPLDDVGFEALQALGYIATARARDVIETTAERVSLEDREHVLQAAARASVRQVVPLAFEALRSENGHLRWRGARLLARFGGEEACRAIADAAEREEDQIWKLYLREAAEDCEIAGRRAPTFPVRQLTVDSPLVGILPIEVRLSRPKQFPASGRWYVVAEIRTRYQPLRSTPSPVRADDAATAQAQAMEQASVTIDESYEAEQRWLTAGGAAQVSGP